MPEQQQFSIGDVFGKAWKLFTSNPFLFIGAFVVTIIASSIASFFTSKTFTRETFVLAVLGNVISFVITSFISIGFTKLILNLIDGKKAGIEALFSGSPWLFNYLLASLIICVIVGVGFIFLIIPGIYLFLRLLFTGYFVIDRNMSATDAVTASWNATKGASLTILLFVLAAIVLNLLGLLAVGVGLLVSVPVTTIAMVYAYRSLAAPAPLAQMPPQGPIQL